HRRERGRHRRPDRPRRRRPGAEAVLKQSLQERYAPHNACFGCGPANERGLHVRSFAGGDEVVADWQPEAWHEAFPGVLSGGIVGTLLDGHSNWAAAHHLMLKGGGDPPPCTVTAEFTVKLLRPTPTNAPVHLRAQVVESGGDRAVVESS